jgi:hypothetical protein
MQFSLKMNFTTINVRTVSDLCCIMRWSFQYLWIKSHVRFAHTVSVFSLINLDSLTLCLTLTIPEHMSTLAGVSGGHVTRSFIFEVMSFSFVFFRLTTVLSVLLRFTAFDYSFGIFTLLDLYLLYNEVSLINNTYLQHSKSYRQFDW